MANVNAPHGLKPLGISLSGGPNFIEELAKAVGLGTAIYLYDAVARVADGSISSAVADITAGTTNYSGVSLNRGAASTATNHQVVTNPDALFEVQSDVTGVAAADLGLNANLTITTGSATTGLSGMVLAGGSLQTTVTLDLHVLKLYTDQINVAGAYARVEVVFNKHRMAPNTVGV